MSKNKTNKDEILDALSFDDYKNRHVQGMIDSMFSELSDNSEERPRKYDAEPLKDCKDEVSDYIEYFDFSKAYEPVHDDRSEAKKKFDSIKLELEKTRRASEIQNELLKKQNKLIKKLIKKLK